MLVQSMSYNQRKSRKRRRTDRGWAGFEVDKTDRTVYTVCAEAVSSEPILVGSETTMRKEGRPELVAAGWAVVAAAADWAE